MDRLVCLSTSAVHIELVTDYTTDAFMTAYKRFTKERNLFNTNKRLWNFKGADSNFELSFPPPLENSEN